MKTVLLLAFVAVATADSGERGGIRPIVNYSDNGSSVQILRGADLNRGRSYETRQKVRYVQAAPKIRYEQRPARVEYVSAAPQVRYVQAAPKVRYVQAAPEVRYVQAAPEVRYVQAAPKVRYVEAPKVRYVEAPQVQYVQPKPKKVVKYVAPKVEYVSRPAPVEYRPRPAIRYETVRQPEVRYKTVSRPRYEAPQESYSNDDARYSFAYEVRDDATYNYQSRQESRDGNKVSGTYVVQDPDGFLRTVKYGDDGYGFYAVVSREPIGSAYKTSSGYQQQATSTTAASSSESKEN